MDLLTILGNRHNEWLGMVYSFSSNNKRIQKEDAEEIVSLMYLKLHKYVKTPDRIMYNEHEINTMYIYITLKNLYTNYIIKRSKYNARFSKEDIDTLDDIISDEIDTSLELSKIDLQDRIKEEIENWYHYDAKLFKVVFYDSTSMRQLSRDSGISLSSIFNSIKTGKLKLKKKFGDEYNSLKSQDEI